MALNKLNDRQQAFKLPDDAFPASPYVFSPQTQARAPMRVYDAHERARVYVSGVCALPVGPPCIDRFPTLTLSTSDRSLSAEEGTEVFLVKCLHRQNGKPFE